MARFRWIPRTLGIACVVVCLAAMGGVVFAQQQTSGGAEGKTVLRGTVVDATTHQPVGRAVVLSPDGRFATMSDERGHFEMVFKVKKGAPAASAAGDTATATSTFSRITTYANGSGSTTSTSDGTSAAPQEGVDRPAYLMARRTGYLNMILRGTPGIAISPDQEEVTIPIVPEARIVGHVTLADGEAARGMQVAIYQRRTQAGRGVWQPVGQAEVKSDGEFRMADLQAGDYKLLSLELSDRDPVSSNPRGEQFGYPPDYYPGAADFEGAALIHLAAGETFQASLTPERRPYHRVHIGVLNGQRDSNGSGLQVEVWKDGHSGPGYALGYDFRDGSIGGTLPDGNYLIKVSSQSGDGLTGVTNLSVKGGPAGSMVTLLGGAVVAVQVTEEFSHSNELRAIVTAGVADSQGRAHRVPSAQVMLWPTDLFSFRGALRAQAPNDPEGEGLEIPSVPAGEYRVQVETPNGYVASVRCGGTDLQKANLVVAAGSTVPPIEVVLRNDGGEVDGTVAEIASRNKANPQGAAMASGYVHFVSEGERPDVKQAFVQQSGEFQITQLAPGTYRVVAFETSMSRENVEWSNEEVMKKFNVETVTIGPGQKEKIRISLSAE